MTVNTNRFIYVPGTYSKKRPDNAQLAHKYIKDWKKKRSKAKPTKFEIVKIPPAICFSRKIGSGALEVADILAEKLQYRVADRELLNYMAKDAELSRDTLAFFAERYPGKMSSFVHPVAARSHWFATHYFPW